MLCLRCQNDFDVDTAPGGILYSPPRVRRQSTKTAAARRVTRRGRVRPVPVDKYHLCAPCWPTVLRLIRCVADPAGGTTA